MVSVRFFMLHLLTDVLNKVTAYSSIEKTHRIQENRLVTYGANLVNF